MRAMGVRGFGLLLLCAASGPGCDGASTDTGVTALLRVDDAQFVPGPMPARSDGPMVGEVQNARSFVLPGETGKIISGALAPEATAVVLGLAGDRGYWILPAQPPDVNAPDQLSFTARLSFSPDLGVGALELQVRAVDAAGHLGPARVVALAVAPATPVMGDLVVSLRWDGDADLDLHVVDPFGSEVFARAPSTLPPLLPGQTPDPEAELRAGFLDFDSGAACVQDGRRNENVVWQAAPTGHYVVRVDTFAMCGAPAARWSVEVRRGDVIIAAARGLGLQADAEAAHDRGGGVYALGFDL